MILKGYRIDILRGEAGLTVTELAHKAGVGISSVQNARHGRKVSVLTAGRLAKALGIPLEHLIELE